MQPKRLSNAQKKQRRYYSGKKKRHTLKTQLVVEKSTRRILCLAHDKGRRHDFRLFKTSKLHLHPETKAVVDSGYQPASQRERQAHSQWHEDADFRLLLSGGGEVLE